MAQLGNKIKLYLDRDFSMEEVLLQDDRIDGVSNPYIKKWNVAEAQPTDEQLNALESQANDVEALNQVYANRHTEDKLAIETKRAEVKAKYPKPVA